MKEVFIILAHYNYEEDTIVDVLFDKDLANKKFREILPGRRLSSVSYRLERWTEEGLDESQTQEK